MTATKLSYAEVDADCVWLNGIEDIYIYICIYMLTYTFFNWSRALLVWKRDRFPIFFPLGKSK